jgi:hypothetical protein
MKSSLPDECRATAPVLSSTTEKPDHRDEARNGACSSGVVQYGRCALASACGRSAPGWDRPTSVWAGAPDAGRARLFVHASSA